MQQGTFQNGNGTDSSIIIKITDDYIYFYFEREYFRQIEWFNSKEDWELEEISQENLTPSEFYGFEKDRWNHPQEHFPSHMMRKTWFTQKMLDFINKNVNEQHSHTKK